MMTRATAGKRFFTVDLAIIDLLAFWLDRSRRVAPSNQPAPQQRAAAAAPTTRCPDYGGHRPPAQEAATRTERLHVRPGLIEAGLRRLFDHDGQTSSRWVLFAAAPTGSPPVAGKSPRGFRP